MDDDLDDDDDVDFEDGDELDDETPEIDVDVEEVEPAEKETDIETGDDCDITARMDSLEAKLDSILDAINNMKYDDEEPLYSDDEEHAEEEGDADEFADDDEDADFEDDDEDTEVVESISYKKMKARKMNEENRLDDFGKHPAYQKKVMTLPSNDNPKRDGQYDMNDSSVDGEAPYGQSKGRQAPLEGSIEAIEDAITESVMKILKKKLG